MGRPTIGHGVTATGFRNAVLGQPLDFTLGTPDGLGGALGKNRVLDGDFLAASHGLVNCWLIFFGDIEL